MQREMPGRVLHDQLGRAIVGNVIVPTFSDRNALEQIFAIVQRLAQLQHAVFVAGEPDAELPAHRAVATVAADKVERLDFSGDPSSLATMLTHRRSDRAHVLRELEKL